MIYVLFNGEYYLNEIRQPAKNVEAAMLFMTENRATLFLNNSGKNIKSLGYNVIPYTLENEQSQIVLNTNTEIINENLENYNLSENNILNINNIDNSVKAYQLFLQAIPFKRKKYADDLDLVEKEIQDILHAIEFNKYNASDGFKIYKMLHEARCRRRKDKDMILKINIISNATMTDWTSGKVVAQFNGLEKRKYEPRALTELFA